MRYLVTALPSDGRRVLFGAARSLRRFPRFEKALSGEIERDAKILEAARIAAFVLTGPSSFSVSGNAMSMRASRPNDREVKARSSTPPVPALRF